MRSQPLSEGTAQQLIRALQANTAAVNAVRSVEFLTPEEVASRVRGHRLTRKDVVALARSYSVPLENDGERGRGKKLLLTAENANRLLAMIERYGIKKRGAGTPHPNATRNTTVSRGKQANHHANRS